MKTFLLLCFILAIASPLAYSQCEAQGGPTTLLQVLANPQKYDGQKLLVIGFLHLEFEGDGLYLHKEDFDNAIVGNVIWVDVSPEMKKRFSQINDKYVVISGTFDANSHGHMDLFSGTLNNITRCDVWQSFKERQKRLRTKR
jgi:hypothetical protein